MTRINAGIPPKELCRQHLLAEHREIKRIPNAILFGKAVVKGIPDTFRLGKGHVKFFYDKLYYLLKRYEQIYDECVYRGYNVTCYINTFIEAYHLCPELANDWEPTEQDIQLVRQRIEEKLQNMKP